MIELKEGIYIVEGDDSGEIPYVVKDGELVELNDDFTIGDNFKFTLVERLWLREEDQYLVFEAKLVDDEYLITWGDDGEYSHYNKYIVESLVNSGDWYIV